MVTELEPLHVLVEPIFTKSFKAFVQVTWRKSSGDFVQRYPSHMVNVLSDALNVVKLLRDRKFENTSVSLVGKHK